MTSLKASRTISSSISCVLAAMRTGLFTPSTDQSSLTVLEISINSDGIS